MGREIGIMTPMEPNIPAPYTSVYSWQFSLYFAVWRRFSNGFPAGRVYALFKVIGILLAQHFHVDDALVDMFFHNGYAALGVVAQDGFR